MGALPTIFQRERVLIVNNLLVSMCGVSFIVLNLPQNCYDGYKQYWWTSSGMDCIEFHKACFFLPVEEGGQGLVSLLSRHAAFRLQFIQKFLTGSVDELWRENHYSESRRTGTGHCFIPHGF